MNIDFISMWCSPHSPKLGGNYCLKKLTVINGAYVITPKLHCTDVVQHWQTESYASRHSENIITKSDVFYNLLIDTWPHFFSLIFPDPHVIIRSNKGIQEDAPQIVNIEPRFVEKVALQNTVKEYGRENLKDISF